MFFVDTDEKSREYHTVKLCAKSKATNTKKCSGKGEEGIAA